MREEHRRGKTPASRIRPVEQENTQTASEIPAQPLVAAPDTAPAEPPAEPTGMDKQTIKVLTAQQLQEAQTRAAEAALEHAVDTERTVEEAYAPRSRRKGRGKPAGAPRKPSVWGILVRALAVLVVLAAVVVIVPQSPLAALLPEGLFGLTRPVATATATPAATVVATPTPTAAPTPTPVDYGRSIVVLDARGDSAFGSVLEPQLSQLGKSVGVPTEYRLCDAAVFADEYAKLTASGEAPALVFGPYEVLAAHGDDMADLKDVAAQLKLSGEITALGADSRILPLSAALNGVFVRKSLWTGALPASYDDLLAGAQALGGNAPDAFPLGLPLGGAAGEAFCRDMLLAYGADLSNPAACNPQDVALAMLWFEKVFDNRLAPTDCLYWDETQACNAVNASVSAVSAGDGVLLQGLDSAARADVTLLPPLKGPKGRACTAKLLGMAMPKAANLQAAAKVLDSILLAPGLLDQALSADPGFALPASEVLFTTLDVKKNPWAKWLEATDVSIQVQQAPAARTASQAVAAVAMGGYTPEEAAAWLLSK